MKTLPRSLAIAVLAGLASAGPASPGKAAEGPLVAELDGAFFESKQADVAVSGSVIVGVSSSNAAVGTAIRNLRVMTEPGLPDRNLCLTVLSRDGVYFSRNTFRLPQLDTGAPVLLPYEQSRLHELLAGYGDRELAIRATAGSCEQASTRYYVVHTNTGAAAVPVRVFVNSFGATDVFYALKSADVSGECAQITEGRRTSFDYWCDIAWPAGDTRPLSVQIQRERYGREMPAVDLTLFAAPHP